MHDLFWQLLCGSRTFQTVQGLQIDSEDIWRQFSGFLSVSDTNF